MITLTIFLVFISKRIIFREKIPLWLTLYESFDRVWKPFWWNWPQVHPNVVLRHAGLKRFISASNCPLASWPILCKLSMFTKNFNLRHFSSFWTIFIKFLHQVINWNWYFCPCIFLKTLLVNKFFNRIRKMYKLDRISNMKVIKSLQAALICSC